MHNPVHVEVEIIKFLVVERPVSNAIFKGLHTDQHVRHSALKRAYFAIRIWFSSVDWNDLTIYFL